MSRLITLMYHDVYINNPNESGIATADCATYKISSNTFEEHLKAIRKLINEGGIQENQISGVNALTRALLISTLYSMVLVLSFISVLMPLLGLY